jgi:hypothetical protein
MWEREARGRPKGGLGQASGEWNEPRAVSAATDDTRPGRPTNGRPPNVRTASSRAERARARQSFALLATAGSREQSEP